MVADAAKAAVRRWCLSYPENLGSLYVRRILLTGQQDLITIRNMRTTIISCGRIALNNKQTIREHWINGVLILLEVNTVLVRTADDGSL